MIKKIFTDMNILVNLFFIILRIWRAVKKVVQKTLIKLMIKIFEPPQSRIGGEVKKYGFI